jgi:ankyrin repeat protein
MVDEFLRHAAPDWRMGGGPYQVRHRHTAERILSQHPELAQANVLTRVVCGDRDGVERILAERPFRAHDVGGPKHWPPLLYLCAGRLTLPAFAEHSVAIARMLLDAGADPNAWFWGGNELIHYTALTLTIGQGEERAPFHPQARALAKLLLERGAEPYDGQVFYNISQGALDDDIIWLLDLIYDRAIQLGRKADWDDPEWKMIDMGGYGHGARFILEHAIRNNALKLAGWALAHGASANAAAARDKRWSKYTLLDEAFHRGLPEMAALLERHGGKRSDAVLEGAHAFVSAALRLDREAARPLLADHPEYLKEPAALRIAAETDRADAVGFLLDLGVSPEIDTAAPGQRALHAAAYTGAARAARLLIDRGALIDPVDAVHDGTPLWWAMWGRQQATIDVLAPLSIDLWALTALGRFDRIRAVIAAKPEAAKWTGESTPLFWLPEDEDVAIAIVDLLLAHGADREFRRADGKTAADVAIERAMLRAGARLA